MIKQKYIIIILILICVTVIFGIICPIAPLLSPDLNDPIIGTWVESFPNGGHNTASFESDGQWSWQEIYNGGSVLRSIPPWYGTWKRLAFGVYSVNQSGSITLWYYNASQDKIYPENATTQLYFRVNSSQKSTNKSWDENNSLFLALFNLHPKSSVCT